LSENINAADRHLRLTNNFCTRALFPVSINPALPAVLVTITLALSAPPLLN